MSRVLNIVYSLLESGPEESGPDDLDPKAEMMDLPPYKEIETPYGRIEITTGYGLAGIHMEIRHHRPTEVNFLGDIWVEDEKPIIDFIERTVAEARQNGEGWYVFNTKLYTHFKQLPANMQLYTKAAERLLRRKIGESNPDELDPKKELMNIDPSADIKKLLRKLHKEDLHVTRWQRAGDILRIEGYPEDSSMTEEDMENGLYAYLQKIGFNVPRNSVTVRMEDGIFVLMFPLPGIPAKSGMSYNGPRKPLGESGPDAIDPKSELMGLPVHRELYSQIKPADGRGTAALQIVLRQSLRDGEWVTRVKNAETGGESWGHYFDNYEKALADYEARCAKYGIPSIPPQDIRTVYESGPDDVNPREYLKGLPSRNPRITITFARTTPESSAEGDFSERGWVDEEGEPMWPDKYDQEEGISAVDKAVKFLLDAGATEPSASHFHSGVWYSTGFQTVDWRTGEDEEKNYHLHEFTEEEEQEIWNKVRGNVPRGWGQV